MRRGREVHQLDIGYPDSPLAVETPERSGRLQAGDRAPDAPVRGAAGQPVRLFDLFRGTHWTLIVQDGPRALVPPRPGLHIHAIGHSGDLVDDEGHFQNAFDLNAGDWILVRPDGYVGAIVTSADIATLESCLALGGIATTTKIESQSAHIE
ncbi:aromatic-ring hydroxylase C-terminal domain-containing protein [Acetobacter conturbans]|uniref:aromatic-ring hydroxylase C-terminal domain-containing protein n=1 Tax=Acetobacter conturbans TaxID=1737472 RepID=UPI0030D2A83E